MLVPDISALNDAAVVMIILGTAASFQLPPEEKRNKVKTISKQFCMHYVNVYFFVHRLSTPANNPKGVNFCVHVRLFFTLPHRQPESIFVEMQAWCVSTASTENTLFHAFKIGV